MPRLLYVWILHAVYLGLVLGARGRDWCGSEVLARCGGLGGASSGLRRCDAAVGTRVRGTLKCAPGKTHQSSDISDAIDDTVRPRRTTSKHQTNRNTLQVPVDAPRSPWVPSPEAGPSVAPVAEHHHNRHITPSAPDPLTSLTQAALTIFPPHQAFHLAVPRSTLKGIVPWS
jgi:hypothetical protein